jgi:hypothetical protein
MACFMLTQTYMARRLSKYSVVTVVSFVLLYYSIAGAVLRCLHDVYNSDQETEISYQNPGHVNFECVGPEYHTEPLAGSAPLESYRFIADFTSHVDDLLLRNPSGDGESAVWRRAVFQGSSPHSSLNSIPRYLSLSVLRI